VRNYWGLERDKEGETGAGMFVFDKWNGVRTSLTNIEGVHAIQLERGKNKATTLSNSRTYGTSCQHGKVKNEP
jgi:hypothetical protein